MAVYTQLGERDIREIAHRYRLLPIRFEAIARGAANSNYLLKTYQGDYVMTLFDEKSRHQVKELGKLLQFLKKQGVPTSHPLLTTNGELATTCKNRPVLVKEYIHGQVQRHLNVTMLHQAGLSLARLHQLPVPDFLTNKRTYGLQQFPRIQGKRLDPAYEAWINKRLPSLEKKKPRTLPKGFIHGDLFYDNILFEGEKLKAVIDFEEAAFQAKAFDLGMAIVGLCRQEETVSLKKAQALVKGYEQVRPLQSNEKITLQYHVEYAATAVSCWRYWKYHIDTPSVDKADKHMQMVGVAGNIRNIPQERFMEMVFG